MTILLDKSWTKSHKARCKFEADSQISMIFNKTLLAFFNQIEKKIGKQKTLNTKTCFYLDANVEIIFELQQSNLLF